MNSVLAALALSLCLTLAVELGAAALCGVRRMDLVIIALMNCLTNPLVNYLMDWIWLWFGRQSALPFVCLAALEIAVVLTEALLLKKLLAWKRFGALRLSLLLNAASFSAGVLVTLAIRALH